MPKGAKRKAWDQMSKYVRLRDALRYCKKMNIDLSQFNSIDEIPGICCTCGKKVSWKQADAGHYFSRGLGGGSGAYFDERNSNFQCRSCNRFQQGAIQVYTEFMLQRWGQNVIDELEILHRGGKQFRNGDFIALGLLYKELYEELIETI